MTGVRGGLGTRSSLSRIHAAPRIVSALACMPDHGMPRQCPPVRCTKHAQAHTDECPPGGGGGGGRGGIPGGGGAWPPGATPAVGSLGSSARAAWNRSRAVAGSAPSSASHTPSHASAAAWACPSSALPIWKCCLACARAPPPAVAAGRAGCAFCRKWDSDSGTSNHNQQS